MEQERPQKDRIEAGAPASEPCNRLIYEKSPYLLQHAHNPVAWYAWGEEAFAKARDERKPIFLSIGYSTCHWCHVMERESFEDPEVARLMNEVVVAIKVDREERPDVDGIYMQACQILTGSGGWPLSVFMTPDKKPFYAATYIPKESRFGALGMVDLIPRIQSVWATRHDDVLSSAEEIAAALAISGPAGDAPDAETLRRAFEQLKQHFDEEHGGFARAPKFPSPHNLTFLMRYWKRSGEEDALRMVEKTLSAMCRGGIYDHVGFGFHRYATDRQWLVPHFEKMLYDQALIAISYLEAFQATGKTFYAQTAREIFTYVLRDLTAPEGGFYSAEDADSEGSEGKFYLWTEEEIKRILPRDEADAVIAAFNVHRSGNFRDEATQRETGTNIFHRGPSDMVPGISAEGLDAARERLFAVREKRIHPHKDDKILTDWNGLMIAALARGGQILDDPLYTAGARKAASFILHLRTPEGRLLHRYREGQAAIAGMVDDYAFLVWGLIELYEATWEVHFLSTAIELTTAMLKHFWDEKTGCLYFTADDAEPLIVRFKEIYDGAVPSGNSVAMLNLLRLARLTADPALEQKAMRIAQAFSRNLQEVPSAYTHLLGSIDFAIGPAHEVVIVGNREDCREMVDALRSQFIPNKVVLLSDPTQPDLLELAPYLKDCAAIGGKATAYVCRNYRCSLPTTDIHKMIAALRE